MTYQYPSLASVPFLHGNFLRLGAFVLLLNIQNLTEHIDNEKSDTKIRYGKLFRLRVSHHGYNVRWLCL